VVLALEAIGALTDSTPQEAALTEASTPLHEVIVSGEKVILTPVRGAWVKDVRTSLRG
jgi:hypothetical protein